jgi:hypothetical protein
MNIAISVGTSSTLLREARADRDRLTFLFEDDQGEAAVTLAHVANAEAVAARWAAAAQDAALLDRWLAYAVGLVDDLALADLIAETLAARRDA